METLRDELRRLGATALLARDRPLQDLLKALLRAVGKLDAPEQLLDLGLDVWSGGVRFATLGPAVEVAAADEVAAAYAAGQIGRSIKAECEARGLPYRSDTSKTARGKYGHEYRRTYNGRTIELGPHVAFGAGSPRTCARIYFFIDEDERRFVIGHVGSHLRDTRTG